MHLKLTLTLQNNGREETTAIVLNQLQLSSSANVKYLGQSSVLFQNG